MWLQRVEESKGRRTSQLIPLSDQSSEDSDGCGERGSEQYVFAFPLSPAQTRILAADRKNPGDPAYNAPFRWSIQGPLNVSVLERTFTEILRRHEILRATFPRSGAIPATQVIAPSLQLRIERYDLRALNEARRETEADRLSAEEAVRRFDLEKGPLIRVILIQMRDEHFVLLMTVHHIVCDGWSIGVIIGEVQKIYTAFAEGRNSPLPELTIQYPDYVVWESEQQAENAAQLFYWTQKLRGCKRLEVPTDFPRTEHGGNAGEILSRPLDRNISDALQRFNIERNATMYVVALASWSVLLRHLAGQNDVAVSSALAGRARAELESLVGLFMNEITLRSDLSGDPLFTDVVDRVRNTVWEAVANQNVPFEYVVDALQRDDATASPRARINFNCHRAYGGTASFTLEFSGLKLSTIPSKSQGALYDLNLFLIERETGWRISLEWNADLYSQASAQRILSSFHSLLEEVASNPHRRLSEFLAGSSVSIGAVDPKEDARSAVRPELGKKYAAADDTESVALVADVAVEEIYDLPASITQERFWLLSRADPASAAFNMPSAVRIIGPLAHDLLERSLLFVVERHEILRTTFHAVNNTVCQRVAPLRDIALPLTVLADAKGSSQLHELLQEEASAAFNLESGPLCRARLFRLQQDEHVLTVTLHHIVSDGWSHSILQRELWSVYEALVAGRDPRLPQLEIQYGDYVVWQNDWLESEQAGKQLDFWRGQLAPPLPVLNFPIDHSSSARSGPPSAIETLRIPAELMRQLKSLGQAEQATMFMLMLAAFSVLLSRYSNEHDMIVGSPSANRRADTEPLIGPFSAPIALRLDLAACSTLRDALRLATSATLDALEHAELPFESIFKHVKIRTANRRTPLFQFYFLYQTAFLQSRRLPELSISPLPTQGVGIPFELQLAIIERPEGVNANLEYNSNLFSSNRIREVLEYFEYLLKEMAANLDQRIVDLAAPVDTSSCVQPGDAASTTIVAAPVYVAPRNATEEKLVQIWQDVLGLPRIGVEDDFFALGGQSLLAAQLFLRVEKSFGMVLNISELIVSPTIERLSRRLTDSRGSAHLVPLRSFGTRPALFCIHSGGGHLLHYRDLVATLDTDQQIYGLRAPDLDGVRQTTTVEDLAATYVTEIRRVQKEGPYHLCGLSFGGLVAYEMAVQLRGAGAEVGIVALFDTGNPSYYRELSPAQAIEFHATYLFDRLGKYARNLRTRQLRAFTANARYFVQGRFDRWIWKTGRRISRIVGTAMPRPFRNNVIMFSEVGRSYKPKPYLGRILLFRAQGRTAEYGSNETLGWDSLEGSQVVVLHVPGDHLTIMEPPYVNELAGELAAYLDEASANAIRR